MKSSALIIVVCVGLLLGWFAVAPAIDWVIDQRIEAHDHGLRGMR